MVFYIRLLNMEIWLFWLIFSIHSGHVLKSLKHVTSSNVHTRIRPAVEVHMALMFLKNYLTKTFWEISKKFFKIRISAGQILPKIYLLLIDSKFWLHPNPDFRVLQWTRLKISLLNLWSIKELMKLVLDGIWNSDIYIKWSLMPQLWYVSHYDFQSYCIYSKLNSKVA